MRALRTSFRRNIETSFGVSERAEAGEEVSAGVRNDSIVSHLQRYWVNSSPYSARIHPCESSGRFECPKVGPSHAGQGPKDQKEP